MFLKELPQKLLNHFQISRKIRKINGCKRRKRSEKIKKSPRINLQQSLNHSFNSITHQNALAGALKKPTNNSLKLVNATVIRQDKEAKIYRKESK